MLNSIVNYGRFPTIVSVQCLEHKQLPRCAHQCPMWPHEKLSWRPSQMFCTGPPLLQAGIEVSSAPCAAVVTPLRHAATQLTGQWRRRQPMVWDPWEPGQPGVYKAITACPGSWIIRVQTSIMKVGCVSVRCAAATLLQAFYLQCRDSDSLCNLNI